MAKDPLIAKALEAQKKSFSPYSKFRVGCAVQGTSGTVYTGCNIENASFGATICAERVALFTGIAQGEKSFNRVVVVGDSTEPCEPCGICRQVIAEFASECELLALSRDGKKQRLHKFSELLPFAFSSKDLT